MITRGRENWSHDIDEIIRSRHYTWLGMGLGGESIEQAVTSLTADIMHICKRKGIPWERVVEQARAQFEQEELESSR